MALALHRGRGADGFTHPRSGGRSNTPMSRSGDALASTRLKLVDVLVLQAGWFACVLGAARGVAWVGPAFVAVALAARCSRVASPGRDLLTAAAVAVPGVLADTAVAAAGVVAYGEGPRLGLLPLWIVALWPLFGVSFHSVLAWLHGRPALAAVMGALGGPPGYFAAERLGALSLPGSGPFTFAVLAVAWGVVMPLGLAIARWIRRRATGPRGARASDPPCRASSRAAAAKEGV
jgi:hypothetical protein